jgi:hypothetical protein
MSWGEFLLHVFGAMGLIVSFVFPDNRPSWQRIVVGGLCSLSLTVGLLRVRGPRKLSQLSDDASGPVAEDAG